MTAKKTNPLLSMIFPFALVCPPGFAHDSDNAGVPDSGAGTSLQTKETVAQEEETLVPFTDARGQIHELWMTQKTQPVDAETTSFFSSNAERVGVTNTWRKSSSGNISRIIMESPNVLQVREGRDCEDSFSLRRNDSILIATGEEKLPSYATQAALVLNGWRLLFIDEDEVCSISDSNTPCFVWKQDPPAVDHHIKEMAAVIPTQSIEMIGDVLHWEMLGGLLDSTGDDPVGMCYTYTVVAWDDSRLNLDADIGHTLTNLCDSAELKLDSCYKKKGSFLNPAPNPSASVAILPHGAYFAWPGGDHHLLQIAKAYRTLGRFETAGSRRVRYETTNIWKDNSQRVYFFEDVFTGLGGTDLEVLQPPFPIAPREASKANACISDAQPFVVTEVEVDVPFEFAFPVLTGWDLWRPCGDAHVGEMGIWLHDIEFDKKAGEAIGTLRYKVSSVFRDADGKPGHRSRPMVSILALHAPRPTDPAILELMINRVMRRASR